MLVRFVVLAALVGHAWAFVPSVSTFAEMETAVNDSSETDRTEVVSNVEVTSVLLVSEGSLDINGAGHTLDGGDTSALFRVAAGARLSLESFQQCLG